MGVIVGVYGGGVCVGGGGVCVGIGVGVKEGCVEVGVGVKVGGAPLTTKVKELFCAMLSSAVV